MEKIKLSFKTFYEKIKKSNFIDFFTNRNSLLHESNATSNLVACCIIIICTFILPFRLCREQQKVEDRKNKQETIVKFSETTTKTLNYLYSTSYYSCKASTDITNQDELKQKSYVFYDKLISLNPPIEVACSMASLYFTRKDNINSIDQYCDEIIDTMATYNKVYSEDACKANKFIMTSKDKLVDDYNKLIKILVKSI